MFAHFIIIFSIRNDKIRYRIFIVISILLATICVLKPYTYDLNKYVVYFETGQIPGKYSWRILDDGIQLDPRDSLEQPFGSDGYERGFRLLAKLGNQLIPHGYGTPRVDISGVLTWDKTSRADVMLLLIMIGGVTTLCWASRTLISHHVVDDHREKVSIGIAVAIILGSIFFFLGSQNTLRQFIGVAIVIMAGTMFVSRKFVLALIFLIFSGLIHKWAPILGIVLLSLLIFSTDTRLVKRRHQILPFRFGQQEWYSLAFGVCLIIGIKAIVSLDILKSDTFYFNELVNYVFRVGEIRAEERWQTLPKAAIVCGLFFITEVLIGKTNTSKILDIRLLRRCVFLFVIPFTMFSEIFSRLLVLYWAIEMIFIIWAVNGINLRARIAGCVVFATYGLAPNGLNVLIGPEWYFALKKGLLTIG